MAGRLPKSDTAFRTIGEVAEEIGQPQHILRYWETRFAQLRPLQRAGQRRYYRPEDVALVRRIHRLLNVEGYTVKGVQQLLAVGVADAPASESPIAPPVTQATSPDVEALRRIRDRLAEALAAD